MILDAKFQELGKMGADFGDVMMVEKDADAIHQRFANAVIGYAEGESVRVDDVPPVEHMVRARVSGKNLLDISSLLNSALVKNEDGTYIITKNGNDRISEEIYLNQPIPSGTVITASAELVQGTVSYIAVQLLSSDRQNTYGLNLTQSALSATRELPSEVARVRVFLASSETDGDYAIFKNLQLEIGNTATEYVPYVNPSAITLTRCGADETDNPQTYTPNSDGTVDGITSLSPTMTLSTDTEGAVIHCEYHRDTNKVISAMQTAEGTIVSQNADFAEVAEWSDGNPNNEDRTGYFVCADVPVHGIVMKKATSIDDVKGVSILAPAFAGNFTKDKLDSNGNLLPKYSYVAIIGFVPVRDNGTCEVGGRCMPDDNGCAIPSSNSMGYQVVNRIDENRVLIIIEPNGDMVQRVKARITELQEDVDNINEKTEWKTVLDTTLTEEQGGKASLLIALDDAEAVANARRMRIIIAFPQTTALEANKATLSVYLQDENASKYIIRVIYGGNLAVVSPTATTKLFSTAVLDISDFNLPSGYNRSFISVHQLPHPHYTATTNAAANARVISGGYPTNYIKLKDYPPYLRAVIGSATAFNAGTRVFVEVQ